MFVCFQGCCQTTTCLIRSRLTSATLRQIPSSVFCNTSKMVSRSSPLCCCLQILESIWQLARGKTCSKHDQIGLSRLYSQGDFLGRSVNSPTTMALIWPIQMTAALGRWLTGRLAQSPTFHRWHQFQISPISHGTLII